MIVCVEWWFEGEMRESEDYGIGFHLCSDPNVKKICEGLEYIAPNNVSKSLLLAKKCIEKNVNDLGLQYGVYMGSNHLAIFKGLTGNPHTPKIAMLVESRNLSNQYSFPDVKIFDDQLNSYFISLNKRIYALVHSNINGNKISEIIQFQPEIYSIQEAASYFNIENQPHATKKLNGGIYALDLFFETKDLQKYSHGFTLDNDPHLQGPFHSIMYKI